MLAQCTVYSFLIISSFKIWSIWFQCVSDFQIIITYIFMLHVGDIQIPLHKVGVRREMITCVVVVCSVCAQLLSHVWVFTTVGTMANQALLSSGFPKCEYWSGLSFPSAGDLPGQRSEPHVLHWWVVSLPLSHQGSPPSAILYCILKPASAKSCRYPPCLLPSLCSSLLLPI